jgi:hypothetical protein
MALSPKRIAYYEDLIGVERFAELADMKGASARGTAKLVKEGNARMLGIHLEASQRLSARLRDATATLRARVQELEDKYEPVPELGVNLSGFDSDD